VNNCHRCGEPLSSQTYRILSDIIDMTVCIDCAISAFELSKLTDLEGAIAIVLLKKPLDS